MSQATKNARELGSTAGIKTTTDCTAFDHARDLLARGLCPIPVPFMEKGPRLKGWQNLRLTPDELPHHFNGSPSNIGVLLGEPSGWIVDIDLDHPRAMELADSLLPHTAMAWGHGSRARSHRLYRLSAPADTQKWASKATGMIVEMRSTGCQTVAPGSTHTSGEPVVWDDDGEPATIDPDKLIAALDALAAAVLDELGEGPAATIAPALHPVSPVQCGGSAYASEALRREAESVAAAPEGTRNDALNRSAFNVGTLVGGGELEQSDAENALLLAARSCGLPETEARRAIASGIAAGIKQPRQCPPRAGRTDTAGTATGAPSDAADTDSPAQAEQLVRLALELFRLGQTAKREPFAVQNSGANVAGLLRGSGGPLRDKLAREYRKRYGRVMNATAYADALATLRGEALEAVAESVHIRIAPNGDGVALDLGTVDGATVLVDAHGWRIADRSPILFQRTALTGIVPTPVAGGRLDALRELLNVSDETWPILLGWIVAAMIPDMPHPILMFGGQQGTGKTTAARFICGLFDPSDAPTRSQPRDPEAWAMSIANGWGTVIDNVSSIPAWWSDALCKAVTGDGWVRRTLYTDGDVSVLSFRRVIVLTSIDAGALRGDLGERLVLVDLEPIRPSKRRTERELDAIYERERPAILGALLDLLAGVLARLDAIDLPELPRMADFARVLAAVDATLGTDSLGLYADQGRRIAGEVIDGDAVGESVLAFVRANGEWRGPVGDLLRAIKPDDAGREWPRSPRGLAGRLRQLAPALALQGVAVVAPPPAARPRGYHLQPIALTPRPPKNTPGDPETAIAGPAVGRAVGTDRTDRPGDRPGDNGRLQAGKADSGRSGDSGGRAQETAQGPDDVDRAYGWWER